MKSPYRARAMQRRSSGCVSLVCSLFLAKWSQRPILAARKCGQLNFADVIRLHLTVADICPLTIARIEPARSVLCLGLSASQFCLRTTFLEVGKHDCLIRSTRCV